MAAPVISLYENDSTPLDGTVIDEDNPVDFGVVDKGVTSDTITIHLWNDKGGFVGSDLATPRLSAVPIDGGDDVAPLFAGTEFNDFQSMVEARSCGSYGVAADQQVAWTPISPLDMLAMGAIPSNAMRVIELRIRVPQDSDTDFDLSTLTLRVHV